MDREIPLHTKNQRPARPLAGRVSLPGMTEPASSSSSEAETKARTQAAAYQTKLAQEEANKRKKENTP